MPSELLPSKRRAAGIGLLNFTNGITTFLALKIFPYLIQPAGDIVPFAIFGTASVLSAVLLWKFVPETRGKSLQEIEKYYRVKSGLETTLFFANMMGQMLDIKHGKTGKSKKKRKVSLSFKYCPFQMKRAPTTFFNPISVTVNLRIRIQS